MSANNAQLTGTTSCTVARDGSREYEVRYLVETTDADDQAITAIDAPGMPRFGSIYQAGNDIDSGAYLSGFSPRLVEEDRSRKLWEVMITYSTIDSQDNPQPGGGAIQFEYPWLQPVRVSGSGFKSEELCREHYTNPAAGTKEVLTNSAGAFFDDEYVEQANFGITVELNYTYANWDINTTVEYVNSLNSAQFFGGPAGYYKMAPPRWSLTFTGEGVPYWSVQYEFEGRFGGWNEVQKVDEGYWYIDRDDGNRVKRFTDDESMPLSGKGRLDGDGDALPFDWDPVIYPLGGINKYRTKDFGNLGIPTSADDVVTGNYSRKQS